MKKFIPLICPLTILVGFLIFLGVQHLHILSAKAQAQKQAQKKEDSCYGAYFMFAGNLPSWMTEAERDRATIGWQKELDKCLKNEL